MGQKVALKMLHLYNVWISDKMIILFFKVMNPVYCKEKVRLNITEGKTKPKENNKKAQRS